MTSAFDWDAFLRQLPPRDIPRSLRELVLRGALGWQIGLIAASLVCVGLAVGLFPFRIVDDIHLDIAGEHARGVVHRSVYANRTYGDDILARKQLVFRVQFSFDDAFGQTYATESLYFGYVEPGTEMAIEYLADQPTVARLRDGFFVPGGLWEVWWAAGFLLPPLFGLWRYRHWRRGRAALLAHGLIATGRIERTWRDHEETNVGGWVEVSYETAKGPVTVAETVERDAFHRAGRFAVAGRSVRVLYAPDNPRHHMVLDLLD